MATALLRGPNIVNCWSWLLWRRPWLLVGRCVLVSLINLSSLEYVFQRVEFGSLEWIVLGMEPRDLVHTK